MLRNGEDDDAGDGDDDSDSEGVSRGVAGEADRLPPAEGVSSSTVRNGESARKVR